MFCNCKLKGEKALAASELSNKVYQCYCEASEQVLESLYRDVEHDFTTFYRAINPDDEKDFSSEFKPKESQLNFNVAFHNRGLFPPSAYHSEGHQDGMGLCLYLALMKQLLGEEFRLVVLDDVVMSVDKHHRRKLCQLLKKEFPNTQFVMTTHDRAWFKQMQTAGLTSKKSGVCFRGWTVDDGPIVDVATTDWEDVETALAGEDIPEAAGRLRRLLESLSVELADSLGAVVTYRCDNDHTLGELLPAVLSCFDKLLKKALASAQQWGNEEVSAELTELTQKIRMSRNRVNVEQWPINKAIHYNSWADFSKEDFEEVLASFKQLLDCIKCGRCNSWLEVLGKGHQAEALKCDCGNITLNLVGPNREQTDLLKRSETVAGK